MPSNTPRRITVAAAQMGPIARAEPRSQVVGRLVEMMRDAHGRGAGLVVFPELALTTFFPRWFMEDPAELDAFYEAEMPGPETRPLFDMAAELGVGFYLGYAELVRGKAGASGATTRPSSSTGRRASSANTARCIFPATANTSRRAPGSIWRSAISRWAISASRSGGRWAA